LQFFADTYEDLYLCVAFCATDMDSVKKDITLLCEWAGYGSDCKVTFADVELRLLFLVFTQGRVMVTVV